MSYTRGENYIGSSGDRTHLWIGDGEDNWAECGWNEGRPHPRPAGVAVPQDVMDEYVVMRFAQLLRERRVGPIVDRALARHAGNGGCHALVELADRLRVL
jgi:hypothetical protein